VIQKEELKKIASLRLKDANSLLKDESYDSAFYFCGYSIELALKAKICEHLDWDGYPSTRSEFNKYQSFRTHDLEVLLSLTGPMKSKIMNTYYDEWSSVYDWNPEIRYSAIGSIDHKTTIKMIKSSKKLLEILI